MKAYEIAEGNILTSNTPELSDTQAARQPTDTAGLHFTEVNLCLAVNSCRGPRSSCIYRPFCNTLQYSATPHSVEHT